MKKIWSRMMSCLVATTMVITSIGVPVYADELIFGDSTVDALVSEDELRLDNSEALSNVQNTISTEDSLLVETESEESMAETDTMTDGEDLNEFEDKEDELSEVKPSEISDGLSYVNDTKENEVVPEAKRMTYSNPHKNTDGSVTYDCVWFGHYIQDYYQATPIKWRVLSSTEDDLFLLSDKVLTTQSYDRNIEATDITWENSTVRSWLNGYGADSNKYKDDYQFQYNSFINSAFTTAEQSAIKITLVDNSSTQSDNYNSGNDTYDKLFFLSFKESVTEAYGFSYLLGLVDNAKQAKATEHAKSLDVMTESETYGDYGDYAYWWLRSSGPDLSRAALVDSFGCPRYGYVYKTNIGIRPALHISPYCSLLSPAGTVCSDGTVDESREVLVYFDSNGGSSVSAIKVHMAEKVAKPEDPIKEGFSFEGWYKDKEYNELYNFDTPVMSSFTLYAKWEKKADTPDLAYGNPREKTDGSVIYDCVWFGNYWQDDSDGSRKADTNDLKTPIKWRVLSSTEDDLFLLSDKLLDAKAYNTSMMRIRWENSTVRSWLNGYGADSNTSMENYRDNNFIDNAFTPSEKAAIKKTLVDNSNTQSQNKDSGNDTYDKLFFLSYKESITEDYGFSTSYSLHNKARRAKATAFAKANGANTNTSLEFYENASWWLRTMGHDDTYYAASVNYEGKTGGSNVMSNTTTCVRPALHISPYCSLLSPAGTVCSDGTVDEIESKDYFYLVHFDSNGGSSVSSVKVHKGEKVTKPKDPIIEGYIFEGWYKDKGFNELYNFDTPVVSGFTLYAKWKKIVDTPGLIYNNPKKNTDGSVTYSCVWFGNYWQDDTNGNRKADTNDRKTPIKWRVLSSTEDDLFLLSNDLLDAKAYNTVNTDITWEDSTVRSWLNGYGADSNKCKEDYQGNSFIDRAFTQLEKDAIKNTLVANSIDQGGYGTDGGNDTYDKLFFLSNNQIMAEAYGFSADNNIIDKIRQAKVTAFARANGAWGNRVEDLYGNGFWWLRSPGDYSNYAAEVNSYGHVGTHEVDISKFGVRPALHISPSSSFLSPAGTVCSDGTVDETAPKSVPVSGISVDPVSKTVKVGESFTITASIIPENATDTNVLWNSKDESIASVDTKGKVTAKKEGTTNIVATSTADNTKKASCEVTVKAAEETGSVKVTFNVCTKDIEAPQQITVYTGKQYGDLPIPVRNGYKFLGWFTEETGGTLVEKSTIVKASSDHTLYAHWKKNSSGGDDSNDVNSGKDGTSITAKKLNISEAFGTKPEGVIRYTIKDKNQKKIASVTSKTGILTGKKSGKVVVTLQKKDGKTWSDVTSNTYNVVVPIGKTLNYGIAYYEGQNLDLNTLLTANEGYLPDSWTIKANSSIATVDSSSGILTVGSKNGSATVYAVYGSGKYARKVTFQVKINHKKADITGAFSPVTGTKRFRIINTSEKKLASVTSKGILTAKKNGSVTVTLQVKDGKTWKDVESHTFEVSVPFTRPVN